MLDAIERSSDSDAFLAGGFPPPSSLFFAAGFVAEVLITAVISLKGEEDALEDEVPCLAVLEADDNARASVARASVARAAAADCAALRDFVACLAIFCKDGEHRRENTNEINVRGVFLAIIVDKK
jgi:hypothetical protein